MLVCGEWGSSQGKLMQNTSHHKSFLTQPLSSLFQRLFRSLSLFSEFSFLLIPNHIPLSLLDSNTAHCEHSFYSHVRYTLLHSLNGVLITFYIHSHEMTYQFFCLLALFAASVAALRYDPQYVDYNLNQNQAAVNPLDYWGEWDNHTFHPSPENWRFPFYTLFLDRFVNADPTNDDSNGTVFEQDIMSTQLRHGGDILGVMDSLDYLQGMGIKAIYIAGSPFINQPWQADSYSVGVQDGLHAWRAG